MRKASLTTSSRKLLLLSQHCTRSAIDLFLLRGHDYTYRRYVGLAFSDEESRDYVVDQVKALKLWGLEPGSLTRLPTKTSTPAA